MDDRASGDAKVVNAARFLLEARASRRSPSPPPEELAPADEAEAWAIHEAVVASLGPVVAWKVGAASPQAAPGFGLITAETLFKSPARFAADAFVLTAVEAEIAVTFRDDMPAREAPYSVEEVFGAIASWHAAIEVLDTAFADWKATPALWKVADRQSHGGLVVGPGVSAPPAGPLGRLAVKLEIDGETTFSHEGGNTAGDPARLLVHLVNARRGTARPILAGDIVTTGSATPFLQAKPGQTVRASFDGLPAAELSISAG